MKLRAKVRVSMTRGVIGWTVYDLTGAPVWMRQYVPISDWLRLGSPGVRASSKGGGIAGTSLLTGA